MNGKKFAVEKKPLFMMAKTSEETGDPLANQQLNIEPFERHRETVLVQSPLAAVFCYYRYYLF